jgi:hypothetical protein
MLFLTSPSHNGGRCRLTLALSSNFLLVIVTSFRVSSFTSVPTQPKCLQFCIWKLIWLLCLGLSSLMSQEFRNTENMVEDTPFHDSCSFVAYCTQCSKGSRYNELLKMISWVDQEATVFLTSYREIFSPSILLWIAPCLIFNYTSINYQPPISSLANHLRLTRFSFPEGRPLRMWSRIENDSPLVTKYDRKWIILWFIE